MRVTKTHTTETTLNLARAHFNFYKADLHGATPGADRVAVAIPGDVHIAADLLLEDVLTEEELATLESVREKLAKATLESAGFEQAADDLAGKKSKAKTRTA